MSCSFRALRSLALTLLLLSGGLAGAAARAETVSYQGTNCALYPKAQVYPRRPAFDAKACAKGKTLLAAPQSSANPFTDIVAKAMTCSTGASSCWRSRCPSLSEGGKSKPFEPAPVSQRV
jgi:hypothetical protein